MSRRHFRFQAMAIMRIFSRHRRTMLRHSASQRRVSLRLITLATLAKPQAWRLAWMLALLWVSVLVVRAGATHYVAHGGQPATTNYESWDTAASNIQDAINVAVATDTVLVSNGVYNVGLTKTPSYSVSNRVCVNAAITLRSFSNNPTNTIIEGAADPSDAVNGFGSNAVRCVYLSGGASLIGFTLTNGRTFATDGGALNDRCAGGVILYTNCVVSNCIIVVNKARDYAGGAYLINGGTMNNCLLTGNYSDVYSGGANIETCGTINNCTVVGNFGNHYIGGVGLSSYATLNNCVISNNTSRWGPGGIGTCCGGTINNCLVVGNMVPYFHPTASGPGGISACDQPWGAAPPTLNNCTVVNNSGLTNGGGIFFIGTTRTNTMNNCIVWGNTCAYDSNSSNICIAAGTTVTVNNTCSGPAQTGLGFGNIGLDPLLVNTNIGNYRLTVKSPCLNTGTNQSWMTNAVDLDGQPRIRNGTVDMGAYENQLQKGTIVSIY